MSATSEVHSLRFNQNFGNFDIFNFSQVLFSSHPIHERLFHMRNDRWNSHIQHRALGRKAFSKYKTNSIESI